MITIKSVAKAAREDRALARRFSVDLPVSAAYQGTLEARTDQVTSDLFSSCLSMASPPDEDDDLIEIEQVTCARFLR